VRFVIDPAEVQVYELDGKEVQEPSVKTAVMSFLTVAPYKTQLLEPERVGRTHARRLTLRNRYSVFLNIREREVVLPNGQTIRRRLTPTEEDYLDGLYELGDLRITELKIPQVNGPFVVTSAGLRILADRIPMYFRADGHDPDGVSPKTPRARLLTSRLRQWVEHLLNQNEGRYWKIVCPTSKATFLPRCLERIGTGITSARAACQRIIQNARTAWSL
jgi:hypothetical protein